MGKFAPDVLANDDLPVARAPQFGGEWQVHLTKDRAIEVASFEIKALNSGVLTKDTSEVAALSTTPSNLVVVCENDVNGGSANVVLTINGTDENDAVIAGTATFAPPSYASVSDNLFQTGYAVDVLTAGDGKKFKTITSVTTSNQAAAKGSKFTIFGMPPLSTFRLVGCTTDKDFTTKSRVPKAIACGMDASAFQKAGRSEPGELNITAKLVSFGDGLARFDGVRCTALCKVIKDGRVATDHLFFLNARLKVRPRAGDGEDEATLAGSGIYEDLLMMPAPTA